MEERELTEHNELNDRTAQPEDPFMNQKSDLVACPFCGEMNVELFSLFGSQLLTTEYYCHNCRTVFEQVKR